MKRIAWSLGAAVLVVGLVLGIAVALLPRESLKTRIGEQIAAWTGRDVSLRGEPEISFFPRLAVTLKDVQVGGPDGMTDAAILSMDRLTGTIRLLPLVIGEVEIGAFAMERPRLSLVVDEEGRRNWEFDSGAAALQLAFAGDVPLGDFLLDDGTVLFENRRTKTNERLDSVNLSIGWRSVRNPLAIAGSGIWRGEALTLTSSARNPFAFLQGGTTPVEARLDSAPISVTFSGQGSDINDPRLAGALTMAAPSLRSFAGWLGSPIGPGSTLGPARLAGAATLQGNVLSVDAAEVRLDDNEATGAIRVVAAPRPDITGTLAFSGLDLTPYFAGFSDAFGPGRDWRGTRLATDWLRDLSADIRLSADGVRAGGLSLGDTAASVSLRDGKLEIGVARAAFEGGSLSGTLAATDGSAADALASGGAASDVVAAAQLRIAGSDLGRAGAWLGLPDRLSGAGSLATDLTSRGSTLGSLVANLAGTATLDVTDGAVPLFGIAEIAAGGLAASPPAVDRSTPVSALTSGWTFRQGSAVLERASAASPAFSAQATGRIVLADGTLELAGTVTPVGLPAGTSSRPFAIQGTLVQPVAKALAVAN